MANKRDVDFWAARIFFAIGGIFITIHSGSWHLGVSLTMFGVGLVAALDAATTPK